MSIFDELKKPFPKEKIRWRVGSTNRKAVQRKTGDNNAKATKGIPLAYIDARDVMGRLDDVMGAENWQAEYPFAGCCRIGIQVQRKGDPNQPDKFEWVWKANGAGVTQVEAEKGQYSDAFKRAAVLWGIGQYLYDLPNEWVDLDEWGKFKKPPSLPQWALPGAKINPQVRKDFYKQVMECMSSGDHEGVEALWAEWDNDEKAVLWTEFNSKERSAMKKIQEEARS